MTEDATGFVPDWDEDAIQEAEYRARALAPFDPDAATRLRNMAAAARAKLTGQPVGSREPYDPMKAYSRAAKFYGWSHKEMEAMHFVTFFAYIREASEINDEEQAAFERAKRESQQGQVATEADIANMVPQMQTYEGETVAIR